MKKSSKLMNEGETPSSGSTANTSNLSNEELGKRDYIILIDKSGSMSIKDCPGGKSRWQYAQEQTEAVARQCEEFDDNGIDIGFFAGECKMYNGVTADKVPQYYKENSPSGSTNTAKALELVLSDYRTRYEANKTTTKPITLIVITDGAPDDEKACDTVITKHANWMTEDSQTGITFLQFGKDEAARRFLQHLDDDLQGLGAKFDIVDTKNGEEMENLSITDLLIAAVTD